MSLSNIHNAEIGLTYDDVLLIPAYSEVIPSEVELKTQFSRNIVLNAPFVSAAMDTVTESIMAIAVAQQGGIGVIHKNLSIELQAAEVRKVKRSESGMIQDPVTMHINNTVGDALKLMSEHKIGGIPVIDEIGNLLGIVTNRDLRFERDMTRNVADVMTKENLITTQVGDDLEKAKDILQEYKIEKLPVVDANNKLVGLITYKDIIKVSVNPLSSKDSYGRLLVAAAVGTGADTFDRVEALVNAGVDAVILDTAHGHSSRVLDKVAEVRKRYPQLELVVGNVATASAAKRLVEIGADAIKVGIGPGSICTTRIIAGIGVPQLSAVNNVARAIEGSGVPVIADGGIRFTGDIVKAIAAGANTVMVGSMFAGVEESPGETILFEGRKYKSYRGMGSLDAMQKGSKDRYFQDNEEDVKKLVPEGIVGRVPYKGKLVEVMYQLIGGLRAGMGYCGAETIDKLQGAEFIRITNAGIKESHPHDVAITREAPNYSAKL